jgi:hypothetical protein
MDGALGRPGTLRSALFMRPGPMAMSEPPALYCADALAFAAFPEPVRPALHFIASHDRSDAGSTLLHFVASLVHPDFVCNLALLDQLPIEAREAMLTIFEYCLTQGMTLEEQGAVLTWLSSRLARMPGMPTAR